MQPTKDFELPQDLKPYFEKARKLEIVTLIYLATVVVIMILTAGSSQAMKTAWIEDLMSSIPSISFLIAARINNRIPNTEYPYGYHRIYSVAFLTGAVALFAIGSFLCLDSIMTLIEGNRASIGSINILGHQVWLGWIMILALVYSGLPPVFLGRTKLPLAKKIHNKILFTDADTQKADWMTAATAILGIVLIGLGLWWADAVAAIIISISVIKDGVGNIKNALKDIMDAYPRLVDSTGHDPLVQEVVRRVNHEPWIKHASVRFRENGQVYFGEVMVVPHTDEGLIANMAALKETVTNMHWKIHEVTVSATKELPPNV